MSEMTYKNYRLDGLITTLSPLSHIGETIGPDSHLSETMVIGPDGQPTECFAYSGNGFRGQLRDLGAAYLLRKLGIALPPDTFHLLFAGGNAGSSVTIDIDQIRLYRRVLPLFSIFAGWTGDQPIHGKMNIGMMWPLVAEAQRFLPERYRDPNAPPCARWTSNQEYSRFDDTKNELLRDYLVPPTSQARLALKGEKAARKEVKGEKERPESMRYRVEYLCPGAQLWQRIDLRYVTELELGAFVSCLHEFAKMPYLGGMHNKGFGLVEAEWQYITPGDEEWRPFVRLNQDLYLPGELAERAQAAYDAFLQELYDRYLEGKAPEIRAALGIGGVPDASA